MCQTPSQNSFNPFYNHNENPMTLVAAVQWHSIPDLSGPKPRPDPARPAALLERAHGHSQRPLPDPRGLFMVQSDISAASFILGEPESLWTFTCLIKKGWTLSRTTSGKSHGSGRRHPSLGDSLLKNLCVVLRTKGVCPLLRPGQALGYHVGP